MATKQASRQDQQPDTERRERTYGQFCPVAAGLDVVGDRWTLLVLRELGHGDRRFTDLRSELVGIAPNLLSSRLRALQEHGLVETAELPPPAARTVYRLTEEGQSVIPLLNALARFGARFLDGEPNFRSLGARRAAGSLLAPWWRPGDRALHARLVIESDEAIDIVTSSDGAEVRDVSGTPDVTVRVDRTDLAAARRTGEPLVATITGSAAARRSFLEQFDLRVASARRPSEVLAGGQRKSSRR